VAVGHSPEPPPRARPPPVPSPARAQGRDRLAARAEPSCRPPRGPLRAGHLPAGRTDQPVQPVLRHHRPHRRALGDLMALGLGLPPQRRMLTVPAPCGFDRKHLLHRRHGQHRPGLPLGTGLPAWATPGGCAPWPFAHRLGWGARGRPWGGARVVPPPRRQLLDRGVHVRHHGFQHRDSRFDCADRLLCVSRRTLPDLLGQRGLGVHGHRMVQEIDAGKHPSVASPT
jgi:hypothetical protein